MIKDMDTPRTTKPSCSAGWLGTAGRPLTDLGSAARRATGRTDDLRRACPRRQLQRRPQPAGGGRRELLSEVVRLKHSDTAEDLNALNERLTAWCAPSRRASITRA
jgi:type VI secretion system protein ImpK